MPPLTPSSVSDSPASWLPNEVLSAVFSYLPSPLDLHHASRVSMAWRAAAVDPRLWQPHYWAFYRPPAVPESEEDRLLCARRGYMRRAEMRAFAEGIQPSSSPQPAFLDPKVDHGQERGRLPNFHSLFVKRINEDDRLMRDLRAQLDLDCGVFDNLLRIIEGYGDGARDLLFSLCSDQQLTSSSIDQLALSSSNTKQRDWPRALVVHQHAASRTPELSPSHCIGLQHTAYQLLGHLQRRQALRAIRQLQQRISSPASTLKARVLESSFGVEEALTSLSLFHFGEASEVSNYLDLLALYVWLELEAGSESETEPWPATTRSLIVRIEASLHRLGFCITSEAGENDLANFFINLALVCPAQRTTSDLVFSGILCAVCRRLGVAAAPTNTPAWIVVVEEGEKPENWSGVEGDWKRFYFVPDSQRRRHRILQTSDVMETVTSMTAEDRANRSVEDFLQPGSPLNALTSTAQQVSHSLRHNNEPAEPPTTIDSSSPNVHLSEQISLLPDDLLARTALPPQPLSPAALASSLALLPPTQAGSPRFASIGLRQDARYCTLWVIRLLEPDSVGGVEPSEDFLMDVTRDHPYLRSDIALSLEMHGCHVKTQVGLTRSVLREKAGEEAGSFSDIDYVDGPEPPAGVHGLLIDAMSYDMEPSDGLGGYGAGGPGSARERELLDPAHPRNAAVRHGVGTVFTHRQRGYRAVVFGWDSTCNKVDDSVPVVSSWAPRCLLA